jgi:hypothetical protein
MTKRGFHELDRISDMVNYPIASSVFANGFAQNTHVNGNNKVHCISVAKVVESEAIGKVAIDIGLRESTRPLNSIREAIIGEWAAGIFVYEENRCRAI